MKTTTRTTPRMTFTAMCRFLAASPVAQTAILRQQKFPRLAHVKNYDKAVGQIQHFAINGIALDPTAVGLEPHEAEVISNLKSDGWLLPADAAARPPLGRHMVTFHGVAISVHPDLILIGSKRGKHVTGAIKFFFPKSYELESKVAEWMSALLFYHRTQVLRDPIASKELCVVHDVRRGRSYCATGRYTALVKQISESCRYISAVWPKLSDR